MTKIIRRVFPALLYVVLCGAEMGLAADVASPIEYDVKAFGAKGDGITDDTVAIQAAIDAAGKAGNTLRFAPGTYIVTSVGLHPGVRYVGYGAVIKRPPGQGKRTRTFTTNTGGGYYSGETDSAVLVLEGLTFDGNLAEQGEYRGYELEHAHLLFLAGDPSSLGRLRARIINCDFQDSVADAISIYVNVDVQILNCRARDCFRGGLVITGGNSRIQVNNFAAEGKVVRTGIDVEVDGAGYGDSHRIVLMISNMHLPDGCFDIAVRDGSVVLMDQVIAAAPFYLHALDSTVRISNSVLGVGRLTGSFNRIVFPHDVTFDNCLFRVEPVSGEPSEDKQWAAAHVMWNIHNTEHRNQTLRFQDCVFDVDPRIPTDDLTHAIFCEVDYPARNNRLELVGGHITSAYQTGVRLRQGGTIMIRDTLIEAQTALNLRAKPGSGCTLDVLIDGVRVKGSTCYADIPTSSPDNRILHRNVDLDESVNVLRSAEGLTKNRYLGERRIHGTKPPTSATHGLPGDRYQIENALDGTPQVWRCRQGGCGDGAVWTAL